MTSVIENKHPMISIIVPIYNIERYILECLDSILAQTFTNWECILVDDGSLDNSGKICDEYVQKDKRFKVFHQKNSGVSVARQRGLDNAIGEYVIHCDPDDWIEEDMLNDMYHYAVKTYSDMIIADYFTNDTNNQILYSQNPGDLSTHNVLYQIISQKLHGSCCNKLIKRNCIINNGITFTPDDISMGEDILFCSRLLSNPIKIGYLPKAYYHYNVCNTNSLCYKISEASLHSMKKVISEFYNFLLPEKFDDFYYAKRQMLIAAFISKRLHALNDIYPEIHNRIIEEGKVYRIKFPISGCLSLALRGYASFAYLLYTCNIQLINIRRRFIKCPRFH